MRYYIVIISIFIPQFLFSNNILHEDDFNTCNNISWSSVSGINDSEFYDNWHCDSYGGRTYMEIYDGDGNNDDDWLISPAFNLDNYNQEYFSFEYDNYANFNGLSLLYSTDYSGGNTASDIDNATWNTLDLNIFDIDNNNYTSNFSFHQSIDLSSISGTSVYLAFRYESASNTQGWTIDNVRLTTDYYANIENEVAAGTKCLELKSALQNLIKGHQRIEYSSSSYDVWDAFYATDKRLNDAATNTIVYDMYSDNPSGPEPYEFTLGGNQDSGSTAGMEGVYYNREHVFPKSWWGGGTSSLDTQYTDLHHVAPSDQYVNFLKANHPLGITDSPSTITDNGTKIGPSSISGYTGTVFEPIDDYKGDFARMLLYMSTRYQYNIPNWSASVLNNDLYTSFDPWLLETLICWHESDPVSQKEIDRNNAIYSIQKNRNPFIDHPEYVDLIWGTCDNVECPSSTFNLDISAFTGVIDALEDKILFYSGGYKSLINSDHFILQHSPNGNRFHSVRKIMTQNLIDELGENQFVHEEPTIGMNYYRLKIYQSDGSFEWSPTIQIEYKISDWIEINPTIVTNELLVNYSNNSNNSNHLDIKIYDLQGKLISEYKFNSQKYLNINLAHLDTGMYIINCQSGQLVETKRIFVK